MNTQLHTPCERGEAISQQGRTVTYPAWTVVATVLASSLAFIDGSVTNVALPTIGADLGGGAAGLS